MKVVESFRDKIREDFRNVRKDRPANIFWLFAYSIRYPGFRAVLYHRIAHEFHRRRIPLLPLLLDAHCLRSTGADIECTARIGGGLVLPHPVGVVIGGGAVIGASCRILQGVTVGVTLGADPSLVYPQIGDNVTLGAGCACLGPIRIGSNVTIGANAVVTSSIPPNSVAAGVPARVIRSAAS